MHRETIAPRPDAAAKLESIGLSFHGWDDYWKEDACYRFDAAQIDVIEAATQDLHGLCLDAVRFAIAQERLGQMGIPQDYWNAIEHSFSNRDFSLYGRFDLVFDGHAPPKMLEYNADTPTSLLESAVAQWYWLEDVKPGFDQFNSLHDKLVQRWADLPTQGPVHVASLADNEEDWVCTKYLVDTITQAGRQAVHMTVEDIGWNGAAQRFVDHQDQPLVSLFKLYPWEWMLREDFGAHVLRSSTVFIEPLWKSVLSCKALLALLWEMYPGHPNLLPAYLEPSRLPSYAKKPFFSREGANIELVANGQLLASDTGPYGAEGYVYQALCQPPVFAGKYPVIGSWIVGDHAAGMCIREDSSPITTNMSNFVPHYFTE